MIIWLLIIVWSDGARFEGHFEMGRAHGKGRFIHVQGEIYEGDWLYDQASGYGMYHHSNGASYEGYWR